MRARWLIPFHPHHRLPHCLTTDLDHAMNDPLHNHVRCTDCQIAGGDFDIYIEPVRLKAYQYFVLFTRASCTKFSRDWHVNPVQSAQAASEILP